MNISDESLDRLIDRLNAGDAEATERAMVAFEPYLRLAVRRRMNGSLRAKFDSVDIVQSVWADVLRRFRDNGWRFTDRGHLRAVLLRIASCRLIDRQRQYQRAVSREQSLDETNALEFAEANTPRPSEIAQGHELWDQLMASCPPAHREIVRLRRDGLRLSEISARVGMHEGSIRRILYDLARKHSLSRRTSRRTEPDATDDDPGEGDVASADSFEGR